MSRGQVDAPIELFVAVIILAMSMTLAFYVMNTSSEAQCIAELKSQARSLEAAMVDVAIGSPPTSREATFNMKSCGTKRIEGLRFVKYTSPDFCRACAGYTSTCWKIEPVYVDSLDQKLKPLVDASVCIEMPAQMGVEDEFSPSAATGLSSNNECIPLASDPCPTQVNNCRSDAPASVAEVWRALGKAGGGSLFVIKLTKRLYLGITSGGVAGQKGYIGVCAMSKETVASR